MSELIPDYMKKKEFIVMVFVVIVANLILYYFDKKMNGPLEVYSFPAVPNVIVFIFVGIVFLIWGKTSLKNYGIKF